MGELMMAIEAVRERPDPMGVSSGRRERNKREKLTRILDAARNLFRTQGFSETTTQQIAAAADIGTGTLFLYASSKEDLLTMVFRDEMLESAQEIFSKLPQGGGAVDSLMAVFEHMVDYHARDINLHRFLLRELVVPSSPVRHGDIAGLMDEIYGGLAAIIRDSPSGRDHDPELAARSAFALYYFFLISWLGRGLDLDRNLAQLRAQLCALLNEDVIL